MKWSPSWEASSRSASKEIPLLLWNPKVHYRVHNSPPISRHCITFRKKLVFHCEELLASRPNPRRTTTCRPSATVYSICLQLPSISGGRLLHPQPDTVFTNLYQCWLKHHHLISNRSNSNVYWNLSWSYSNLYKLLIEITYKMSIFPWLNL